MCYVVSKVTTLIWRTMWNNKDTKGKKCILNVTDKNNTVQRDQAEISLHFLACVSAIYIYIQDESTLNHPVNWNGSVPVVDSI